MLIKGEYATPRELAERSGVESALAKTAISGLITAVDHVATTRVIGGENIKNLSPNTGAVVIGNHISQVDSAFMWVTLARLMGNRDREEGEDAIPHFVAKYSLFGVPGLGEVLAGLKQIPVSRGDEESGHWATQEATKFASDGGLVYLDPEGTTTRTENHLPNLEDPKHPLKTGAVRIAAEAGVPLIPAAQWGAQELFDPSAGNWRKLHPLARPNVRIMFGPPVSAEKLLDQCGGDYRLATRFLMGRISVQAEKLSDPRWPHYPLAA